MNESKYRNIEKLTLGDYVKPTIPGNPGFTRRTFWYVVNVLFFQNHLLGLIPSSVKAGILRFFGARIGRGLVCKPGVSIKSPWFLEIGDHVWIGEKAWIDNHCLVKIGSNCCLSQGVYVYTGNHDYSKATFDYFSKPISIGEGVWVAAFATVHPGDEIPPHVIVKSD